ncbi:hypothetical protein DVH24_012310 [Malus domestica]|uniref:Protein kinase domain-containing protein n=1 Tax=Malus domestica TaxID=3750 RepID=A0A498HMD3_MALDO|nr:hypothetical protein DVH24_012310 [Malus domestica]
MVSTVGVETRMENSQNRIRKRPRSAWDVGPSQSEPEAQRAVMACNEGNGRRGSPPKRDDDREGHYIYNLGENLTSRCTFGRVLECWDRQTREYVAIKVVRSIRKYREAAMIEVDVLEQLAKHDKGNSRCVQIRTWFDYRNHICIVNMHDLRLIHTDLKPENILLVSSEYVKLPGSKRFSSDETNYRCLPKSSAIKLIDFGSTVSDDQNHSSIVSTRHYRAPEIILGLGWTYPCDLWSIGCILIELCSGEALFQTHENLEHLAMMERILGPLPQHMTQKANHGAEKYFRRGARLNWPLGAVSRESIRAVKKLDCLKDLILRLVGSSKASSYLTDLLYGLLKYDPSERLTARQALDHPFFKIPT